MYCIVPAPTDCSTTDMNTTTVVLLECLGSSGRMESIRFGGYLRPLGPLYHSDIASINALVCLLVGYVYEQYSILGNSESLSNHCSGSRSTHIECSVSADWQCHYQALYAKARTGPRL